MRGYARWEDAFGMQVSLMRERRDGYPSLLMDSEVNAVPGMDEALFDCYREGVKPKDAAIRYIALVDHNRV